MANPYINIYKGNPTAGGTDGTAISTDGVYTEPLSVTLDASINESKTEKLAIRTEDGYETSGNTTISINGDDAARWGLSFIQAGTYTTSLTLSNTVTAANQIFYAKATSNSSENPTAYYSSLSVTGKIVESND